MRKFLEDTLVLATHNNGKIEELSSLFNDFHFDIKSPIDFNLKEPIETENTFLGNARLKAHYTAKNSNLPALADDSGIEVECLNGAPGVFTANWAETKNGRNFGNAMKTLWEKIKKTNSSEPYKAQFCCTLVLAWPDGHDEVFQGIIKGELVWPIRGSNGHGFDPMFRPYGYSETFGEMNRWEKNTISHRGLAFADLIEGCFNTSV